MQGVPQAAWEAHQRQKAIKARIAAAAANVQPKQSNVRVLAPGELGFNAFDADRIAKRKAEAEAFEAGFSQLQQEYAATFAHLSEKPDRIIARVAASHGVTADDIVGEARQAKVVVARYAAIAEVRRVHPTWSLPRIGRLFNRDHTTVLHALRKLGLAEPTGQRRPRHYGWTDLQSRALRCLWADRSLSVNDIAKLVGKSRTRVLAKAEEMGLRRRGQLRSGA